MHHFFVEPSAITGERIYITGEDAFHIKNVLRMKEGDEISVSNNADNKEYRCGIEKIEQGSVECVLRFIKEESGELSSPVSLYQGLPKGDKMEFIIQKAVELGVSEIIPVAMKRCVVKLDEKREKSKLARWQQIAKSASEQSRRPVIPQILPVMSFDEALKRASQADVPLLPYEMADGFEKTSEIIDSIKPGNSVSVMIGPEGGFDLEEIKKAEDLGMNMITLGKRILRTETAGMVMLSILMYESEKKTTGEG